MIARVDPKNGVTILEPTCASWTWINRGTSLRSVDPFINLVVFVAQMGSLVDGFNLSCSKLHFSFLQVRFSTDGHSPCFLQVRCSTDNHSPCLLS